MGSLKKRVAELQAEVDHLKMKRGFYIEQINKLETELEDWKARSIMNAIKPFTSYIDKFLNASNGTPLPPQMDKYFRAVGDIQRVLATNDDTVFTRKSIIKQIREVLKNK